ncbi:MAG: hypothetical protein ABIP75_09715 [Pyrinomonadaceae bacterium]
MDANDLLRPDGPNVPNNHTITVFEDFTLKIEPIAASARLPVGV